MFPWPEPDFRYANSANNTKTTNATYTTNATNTNTTNTTNTTKKCGQMQEIPGKHALLTSGSREPVVNITGWARQLQSSP